MGCRIFRWRAFLEPEIVGLRIRGRTPDSQGRGTLLSAFCGEGVGSGPTLRLVPAPLELLLPLDAPLRSPAQPIALPVAEGEAFAEAPEQARGIELKRGKDEPAGNAGKAGPGAEVFGVHEPGRVSPGSQQG